MRIKADREICVGAGMCAITSGQIFAQDDFDGRVVLLREIVEGEDLRDAREAVELCPSAALELVESE